MSFAAVFGGRSSLSSPTPPAAKVPVFILLGQSNAGGSAPISGLNATYASAMSNVKTHVWNTDTWATFDAGVNNRIDDSGTQFQFFGPEVTAMYALDARFSGNIYLIKYWSSGAIIHNASGVTNSFYPEGTSGTKFQTALDRIGLAMAKLAADGVSGEIRAVFWVQGETDSSSATYSASYQSNLSRLCSKLRKYIVDNGYGQPNVRFILNTVPNISPAQGYETTVRAAQLAFAESGDNTAWVEAYDLSLIDETPDIHYTAGSQETLGFRLAEAVS